MLRLDWNKILQNTTLFNDLRDNYQLPVPANTNSSLKELLENAINGGGGESAAIMGGESGKSSSSVVSSGIGDLKKALEKVLGANFKPMIGLPSSKTTKK